MPVLLNKIAPVSQKRPEGYSCLVWNLFTDPDGLDSSGKLIHDAPVGHKAPVSLHYDALMG